MRILSSSILGGGGCVINVASPLLEGVNRDVLDALAAEFPAFHGLSPDEKSVLQNAILDLMDNQDYDDDEVEDAVRDFRTRVVKGQNLRTFVNSLAAGRKKAGKWAECLQEAGDPLAGMGSQLRDLTFLQAVMMELSDALGAVERATMSAGKVRDRRVESSVDRLHRDLLAAHKTIDRLHGLALTIQQAIRQGD